MVLNFFICYSAASAFLRGAFFTGFGFSSAAAAAVTAAGLAAVFFLVLLTIAILGLELPNEALKRLPFF